MHNVHMAVQYRRMVSIIPAVRPHSLPERTAFTLPWKQLLFPLFSDAQYDS